MRYNSLCRTFLLFLQDVTEFPADLDAGTVEVFTDTEAFRAGHYQTKYRECHGWRVPDGEDGIDCLPGADEQPVCDTLGEESVLEYGAVNESPMMRVPDPACVVHQVAVALHDFLIIHTLPQQAGLKNAGGIDVDELQKHQE